MLVSLGANTEIANKQKQTPLFLACWRGYVDIVTYLVKNNAKLNA